MYGISIDDRPEAPVGTPGTRRTVAIHWDWTTEHSREEMASALGVTKQTIDAYLESEPSKEVQEKMNGVEATVRIAAVSELKDQLRRAGHESKTAERPVKIYEDENGDLVIHDEENDAGETVDRFAVPVDLEMGPDQKTRFFRREEVREIIDLLTDIVGAKEPDRKEITGEDGGPIDFSLSQDEKEALDEANDVEPDTQI